MPQHQPRFTLSVKNFVCVSPQVDIGQSVSSGVRSLGAGSLRTVLREVVTRHGYAGLYAGLVPRMAKIAPACGIMIASYETCKDYFSRQNLM